MYNFPFTIFQVGPNRNIKSTRNRLGPALIQKPNQSYISKKRDTKEVKMCHLHKIVKTDIEISKLINNLPDPLRKARLMLPVPTSAQ